IFRDAAADSYDSTGQFMPKDLWRLHVAIEDFLYVGAANTAGSDLDQHLAVAHFRNRHLLHANDTLAAVNAGTHVLGDGPKGTHSFNDCARAAHPAATSLARFSILSPAKPCR